MIKLFEATTIEELEKDVNDFEAKLGKLVKSYISHQQGIDGKWFHFATLEWNPFSSVQKEEKEKVSTMKWGAAWLNQDGTMAIKREGKDKYEVSPPNINDSCFEKKGNNYEFTHPTTGTQLFFLKNQFKKPGSKQPDFIIYPAKEE